MELKEAEKLADEFPEWVGNFLKGAATALTQPIRWFIQTLYEKGYMIIKKPIGKDVDGILKNINLKNRS